MTPTDVIVAGCRMAKVMVHRMTADLTPAEWSHQPVPGANSAAWVVGHLALTARRTAEELARRLAETRPGPDQQRHT